jgi:hypothetical protein
MTVLEMTRGEFSRLEIVVAIEARSMSVNDAAAHPHFCDQGSRCRALACSAC